MGIDVVKLRAEFKGAHHLIKASDGKVLFLRAWDPPTLSQTAILIFHGITAYSGVYDIIGKPVSNAGYSIFALDLRGHGMADGKRGDYPSKDRLYKDICETIAFLKQKFEKIVLLGHSLGNLVAFEALLHCTEKIDGLILVSVGRTIKPSAYPKMSAGKKFKLLFKFIFAYTKPVFEYKRDGMVGLDDPLMTFKYTPRFLNILNAAKFQKKFKFPVTMDIPVFVSVVEYDELFSVETEKAFFDEVPSKNKEFYVIPGAKHAEYPEGSWTALIKWLKKSFT